jgi:hypothetical protein
MVFAEILQIYLAGILYCWSPQNSLSRRPNPYARVGRTGPRENHIR